MKLKNLICGVVGIASVTFAANAALLDTAARKEACNDKDGYLWVNNAADGKPACISKYPCKNSAYSSYCNLMFKDVQVTTSKHAKELMNLYLKKKNGTTCNRIDMDEAHWVGQDRIRCHLSDGGYMEFEFDDYSESINSTGDFGYAEGVCMIYGGKPSGISKERAIEYATAGTLVAVGAIVGGGAVVGVAAGAATAAGGAALGGVGAAAAGGGSVGLGFAIADIAVALTNDTLLTCEGVSASQCNEMYNGMAAYEEEGKLCMPYNDFIY